MAYVTTNPPVLTFSGGIDRTVPRQWIYVSTDAAATVDTSGYITDAKARGMRPLDLVQVVNTTTSPATVTQHIVVTINANGSADLSDGTSEVASANTD